MRNQTENPHLYDEPEQANGTEARRRTLKALLSGAGVITGAQVLPEKWVRPSISSVVLPSHAQATTFSCVPGSQADLNIQTENFEYAVQSPVFDAPDGTTVTVEVYLENAVGDGEVAEGASEAGLGSDPMEYTRVIENGTISEIDGFFEFFGSPSEFNVRYSIDGREACIFEQDLDLP